MHTHNYNLGHVLVETLSKKIEIMIVIAVTCKYISVPLVPLSKLGNGRMHSCFIYMLGAFCQNCTGVERGEMCLNTVDGHVHSYRYLLLSIDLLVKCDEKTKGIYFST